MIINAHLVLRLASKSLVQRLHGCFCEASMTQTFWAKLLHDPCSGLCETLVSIRQQVNSKVARPGSGAMLTWFDARIIVQHWDPFHVGRHDRQSRLGPRLYMVVWGQQSALDNEF